MRKKKFFAGVMTAAMIMGSLTLPETINMDGFGAISARAAEVVDSGTCGDNLTWVLDDEGTLTISGTGEMEDYEWEMSPWYSYITQITSVIIEDGVTGIGDSAFFYCYELTNVEMPDSVTTIGDDAFCGCNHIEITIPASVTSIGTYAIGYFYIARSGGDITDNYLPYGPITLYGYEGSSAEKYVEEYRTKEYSADDKELYERAYGILEEIITFVSLGVYDAADETVLGDANFDGNVDYLDAMIVLRADAELIELTDEQLTVVDVNEDDSVDSLDAILILRYDAGLIESFE